MFSKHKQSLYEGTFPYRIAATYSKGRCVYQDGGRKQSGAFGTFLKPSLIKSRFSDENRLFVVWKAGLVVSFIKGVKHIV